MVFQPIANLRDRTVVGFEALARFNAEPAQAPDVWFATAERGGLRVPLELAAVEAAIVHLPLLPPGVFLSVNVSPDTAVSADLEAALDGAAPERMVVEITEHAPIDDYDAVTPGLQRLRARGIRLAIDDAGAGFASLRHILRLAPDFIKTDMTLTRNITSSRAERALTSALIAFAGETGARIIAEGIESDAELSSLAALGVRYGQGYHLGRPAPAPAPTSSAEARCTSADESTTATARRFLGSHR
jgi:EAL domain-containing protein (putative c-di-GMP-specific phosphodiesterase class I)